MTSATYWKRFAGYEGGVADPLIVSWPRGISARAEVRHQYVHAVDVVPPIYEMLGVDPSAVLKR
jgi:arylsulfatase A-like enzyme